MRRDAGAGRSASSASWRWLRRHHHPPDRRAAGVTIGALQHHFAAKSDLIAAAMRVLSGRLTAEFMADVERMDDPPAPSTIRWSPSHVCSIESGTPTAARSSSPAWSSSSRHAPTRRWRRTMTTLTGAVDADRRGDAPSIPRSPRAPGFAEHVFCAPGHPPGPGVDGSGGRRRRRSVWTIARPQMLRTLAALLADDLPFSLKKVITMSPPTPRLAPYRNPDGIVPEHVKGRNCCGDGACCSSRG